MKRDYIYGTILAVTLLGAGLHCQHVKEVTRTIPPGAVAIHLSPELADLVRKVAIHNGVEGITVSRWATVFLIPPEDVSDFLKCHEREHNLQFAEYDNDIEALEHYAGAFVRSTVTVAIVQGVPMLLMLVPDILNGKVDPKKLAAEEGVKLLQAGYANHPWEVAANKACEHLL